MTATRISLHRSVVVMGVLALLFGFAAALIASGTAQAQTPAICDEYPNLPVCDEGGGGGQPDGDGTGDEDPAGGGAGGPAGGGPSGDADGSLPFTGYPITDLLLLLVALLLAGLAIRGYLALRERGAQTGSA